MCLTPLLAQAGADIERLMTWSQGAFDNHVQAGEDAHFFPLDARYRRVDLPAFGAHVLYAEEYRTDGERRLHSARLQVLTTDGDRVRVAFKPLRHPETVRDDPTALTRLTPADVISFPPDCDVLLSFDGHDFRGGMATQGCRRGPEMRFEYELIVGDGYQWFREQARRFSDGSVGWEQAPGSNFGYFKLVRAAP
jgi:hypothetical protein